MNYKWIGAILVIIGCGGFGFSLAAAYRREERVLRQLLRVLEDMECQLQYHLTPLPELCRIAGKEANGNLRELFSVFAQELDQQIGPDASSCMAAALSQVHTLPSNARRICTDLGRSLGRFDLAGQIKGLESVKASCRSKLDALGCNRDNRLRSYQTLGICAGLALAILLI